MNKKAFFRSLYFKINVTIVAILFLGIGSFTWWRLKVEEGRFIKETKAKGLLLINTIETSLITDMEIGRTEEVEKTLINLKREGREITQLRIIHETGRILRSAHPEQRGQTIDPAELELYRKAQGPGIFWGTWEKEGEENLHIIKPIYNQPRCYKCHDPGQKINGVLEMDIFWRACIEILPPYGNSL